MCEIKIKLSIIRYFTTSKPPWPLVSSILLILNFNLNPSQIQYTRKSIIEYCIFLWILNILLFQKAIYCLMVLHWSWILHIGFCHLWNLMAHLHSQRTTTSFHFTSSHLLSQQVTYLHRSQSYLPWAYQTHWHWFSHCLWEALNQTLPLSPPLLPKTILQISSPCPLSSNLFTICCPT